MHCAHTVGNHFHLKSVVWHQEVTATTQDKRSCDTSKDIQFNTQNPTVLQCPLLMWYPYPTPKCETRCNLDPTVRKSEKIFSPLHLHKSQNVNYNGKEKHGCVHGIVLGFKRMLERIKHSSELPLLDKRQCFVKRKYCCMETQNELINVTYSGSRIKE